MGLVGDWMKSHAKEQPSQPTPGAWAWDEDFNTLRPVTPNPEASAVHTILSPDGPRGYLGKDSASVNAEMVANYWAIQAAGEMLKELQRLRAVLNGAGFATERTDAVIARATGAAS